MSRTSFAVDINSLFPLILLFLFLVLPGLLKRLGQYSTAGKNAQKPPSQERETLPEERMHEYLEDTPVRNNYELTKKETSSNKPITPKWF
jgi:hypothetical protein